MVEVPMQKKICKRRTNQLRSFAEMLFPQSALTTLQNRSGKQGLRVSFGYFEKAYRAG